MRHRRYQSLRRLLISLGFLVVGLFAAGLLVDAGTHLGTILFDPAPTHSEVKVVLRDITRLLGVTLSMLVALIAIAIPLTANVYTPKLIELFVADRGNRLVLAYYVFANAFVLWNAYFVFDTAPESARLRVFLALLLALGGLLFIVPYIYYVMRFLIPRSIIQRMEQGIVEDLGQAVKGKSPEELKRMRRDVLENIQYLGKIVLRSVDRYDRDSVFQGLQALQSVFNHYQGCKADLPADWFRQSRAEMLGQGPNAIEEAQRHRAGIEVAILGELSLALQLAMGRLPEVVARLAVMTRRFGVRTSERGDTGAREQVTLFFNTYLRAALQRRQPDTFYKFVFQYRRFVEAILEQDPEHVKRIAFFLDYYGHQAVRMGMGFLINVVAYDLAELTQLAYKKRAASREALLEQVVGLDRDTTGLIEMPGVMKAQIILAARLRTTGEVDACQVLVLELKKVPYERLSEAFAQIVATNEPNFWEVADRRRHLDYLEPQFRLALEALRTELLGDHQPGRKTKEFLRSAGPVPAAPVPRTQTRRAIRDTVILSPLTQEELEGQDSVPPLAPAPSDESGTGSFQSGSFRALPTPSQDESGS